MPITINIQDFIDSRNLSAFQPTVIIVCFPVVAVDGFDTAAAAFMRLGPGRGVQHGSRPRRNGRRRNLRERAAGNAAKPRRLIHQRGSDV